MPSLFDEDIPQRPEIVEGLFREGQIVTIAGAYNVGKTPLLIHLAVCIATGKPWCGRRVLPRHIVHADFESSLPNFVQNYRNISTALNCEVPATPGAVEPCLLNANRDDLSKRIRAASKTTAAAKKFLRECLQKHPDTLFIIDPVEMFFSQLNLIKGEQVLITVDIWRELFAQYPQAAVLSSHNLRKPDSKRTVTPDLLDNVHGWLNEISGSSNLLNRSDVRVGMDRYRDDVRIINGIRRSEDMHPILLLPVEVDPDDPERLGGYRAISAEHKDLKKSLGPSLATHFEKLPQQFRFNEVANNGCPRGTLWKLLKRSLSLGYVTHDKGVWAKVEDSRNLPVGQTGDYPIDVKD